MPIVKFGQGAGYSDVPRRPLSRRQLHLHYHKRMILRATLDKLPHPYFQLHRLGWSAKNEHPAGGSCDPLP